MRSGWRLAVMIVVLGVASCVLCGYPAHALKSSWTLPQFSCDTSDETDPALLDAIWRYDYNSTSNTFDITVENQTADPFEYKINQLYFNMDPDYFSGPVTLTDNGGIGTAVLEEIEHADGYGMFDFELSFGGGQGYGGGVSKRFSFSVGSGADVTAQELFGTLSTIPPGHRPRVAVIKWIAGPGDDSAFSSTPESCTLLLLAASAASIGFMRLRRRKA